jgi:hypothetical protein
MGWLFLPHAYTMKIKIKNKKFLFPSYIPTKLFENQKKFQKILEKI